jgi:hypothetical protein
MVGEDGSWANSAQTGAGELTVVRPPGIGKGRKQGQ